MRQEKRQSSTIRKRIRRLYRQMRFKFWLAEQDYYPKDASAEPVSGKANQRCRLGRDSAAAQL